MEALHRDVAVVFPITAEEMPFDAAHEDDVENGRGEVLIEEDGLRDVADGLSGELRFVSEHLDIPVFRSEKAENQLEQRRLASAVGADHRREHAFRDLEIDVMEDFSCVV